MPDHFRMDASLCTGTDCSIASDHNKFSRKFISRKCKTTRSPGIHLDVVGGSWTDMSLKVHSAQQETEGGGRTGRERKDMSLKVGPDETG